MARSKLKLHFLFATNWKDFTKFRSPVQIALPPPYLQTASSETRGLVYSSSAIYIVRVCLENRKWPKHAAVWNFSVKKGKQSKRMNAISLDNSLHFSGSPFAFLGIFSLDRETPNSATNAFPWHTLSRLVLHCETYPDVAHQQLLHIANCTLNIAQYVSQKFSPAVKYLCRELSVKYPKNIFAEKSTTAEQSRVLQWNIFAEKNWAVKYPLHCDNILLHNKISQMDICSVKYYCTAE